MAGSHPSIRSIQLLGARLWDPTNDILDVEVILEGGEKFIPTFATPAHVAKTMRKDRTTGESGGGAYFAVRDLVVVPRLTLEAITRCVEQLAASGALQASFQKFE
jgi:hypothetical protein